MTKRNNLIAIQRAVDMGNCAYDYFEHVAATLQGMEAISQAAGLSDRVKLMRLEKSIKTALLLTHDGAGLVDAETEVLKDALSEN